MADSTPSARGNRLAALFWLAWLGLAIPTAVDSFTHVEGAWWTLLCLALWSLFLCVSIAVIRDSRRKRRRSHR
jgi:hypothetical protein